MTRSYRVEIEQKEDGRFLAEVVDLPGVLAALLRIGWSIKREAGGSHRVLERAGFADFVWAFHDRDEIGPRMLARIARRTGSRPEDL